MNLKQSWGSDFWSNATSSVVFAAAHLSSANQVPLPQLALGSYLAWLAKHNKWTLSEGVFIHTWWDIFTIAASLADNSDRVEKRVMLPPFEMTF